VGDSRLTLLDVDAVVLIAADAHQMPELVAADHDGDVPPPSRFISAITRLRGCRLRLCRNGVRSPVTDV